MTLRVRVEMSFTLSVIEVAFVRFGLMSDTVLFTWKIAIFGKDNGQ